MPLLEGKDQKTIAANIREMSKTHSRRQSIAAALNTAYGPKKRADGGETSVEKSATSPSQSKIASLIDRYTVPGGDWYKGPLQAGTKLVNDLSDGSWRTWKVAPRRNDDADALANEPSAGVNRAAKGDKKAKGGAVASALRAGRVKPQKRADGGHVGPLPGATPGRADAIHTSVEDGSYIVPAYVVSFLGEGNTQNGYAKLEKMFPHSRRRAEGGLIAGSSVPHMSSPRLLGLPHPHLVNTAPHLAGVPRMRSQISPMHVGMPKMPGMARLAKGGNVDVRLSDGEYAIPPEAIVGKYGDLNKGHRELDKWVESKKKEAASWLKRIPGPVKS